MKKSTKQALWWAGGLVGAVAAYFFISDRSADRAFQIVWPGAQADAPDAGTLIQTLAAAPGVTILDLSGPHFDAGVTFYIVSAPGGIGGTPKGDVIAALGWG